MGQRVSCRLFLHFHKGPYHFYTKFCVLTLSLKLRYHTHGVKLLQIICCWKNLRKWVLRWGLHKVYTQLYIYKTILLNSRCVDTVIRILRWWKSKMQHLNRSYESPERDLNFVHDPNLCRNVKKLREFLFPDTKHRTRRNIRRVILYLGTLFMFEQREEWTTYHHRTYTSPLPI